MAQLAVAQPVVGESRRSAHRRQRRRNKDHSQQHHYPSSYAHYTSFLSVRDELCRRDGGLLEGSAGLCAEPSRYLCVSHLFAAALQFPHTYRVAVIER